MQLAEWDRVCVYSRGHDQDGEQSRLQRTRQHTAQMLTTQCLHKRTLGLQKVFRRMSYLRTTHPPTLQRKVTWARREKENANTVTADPLEARVALM